MNIKKSGIQKKCVAAALLCASVTSFPLYAENSANWWERWQDNQAFNEALDELGMSYQLLAENPQRTLTRSADPTDILYWQKRTMQIYGDADKDIYYIPAIEPHASGRDRTTVKDRNGFFYTYYYGEQGDTFTLTTSSQPDDVPCTVGLENEYAGTITVKNQKPLNANSSTQYTMSENGFMLLSCRDKSGTFSHMDTLVRVDVTSTTATKHPFFILGLNTKEEWKTLSQQSTPSGQIVLFDGRSRYVASNAKAKASLNSDVLQMLREQLSYVVDYDKANGLDGSSYLHQPLRGLNLGTFNSCCYSQWNSGRIEIGFDSNLPTATSWGYWHEYGHQNQMEWRWDNLSEVTNNILSVSACRLLRGEVTDKSCHENLVYNHFTWDQQAVGAFLKSGETHQFDTDGNVFRKLMMFTQLKTSWPDLYPYIGKAFREIYNEGKGKSLVETNQQKIDFFVVNASKGAGHDLREFFTRWGLGYSAEADAQIAALKLPAVLEPSVTYSGALENTGNESSHVRIKFTNPDNLLNVGFIANSKSIGPTSLQWMGTQYGNSLLYAQVTDKRHRQFTVKLHGQRSPGICEPFPMNSAVNCTAGGNVTELHVFYNPSDNPDLPAGDYTGNLRLIARDWHKAQWTGDVDIALSITK
ncbi:M60 family metallopeptidase [Enterobacter bugandensis]|uniref:M60 family metallopeptidase n=1 Tax=Enterobacter bugandensis TaxID=881260 RepID=UPI0021CF6656|nr:M60 family metallopeptidase [Enterobacter bugandensis]MCU6216472.1 M60 family metallopeptidase [Enterobacter bugandensis]